MQPRDAGAQAGGGATKEEMVCPNYLSLLVFVKEDLNVFLVRRCATYWTIS